MKELVCLAMFIILSALFAIAMVIAGFICQYKKKSHVKSDTYECGIEPLSEAWIQFDVKYFHYAILFLIFDIETIFLYPFALFVNELGLFSVIEALVFIGLLLFGLIYAVQKKVLRWQ